MSPFRLLTLLTCLVPALFLGCDNSVGETVIEGKPPIVKIVIWDSEIEIYTSARWQELVHTRLFDGLRPGMTFADARRLLGPPASTGQGNWGPYYRYVRPSGDVVIGFEEIGSGMGSAKFTSWRLTAYPTSARTAEILTPILSRQLGFEFKERTEIVIMAPDGGYPTFSMVLENDRIRSMTWLAE